MTTTLTKKYQLIWDLSTLIIQNEYQKDYSGSITMITDNGSLGFFESDLYGDIEVKIIDEGLKPFQE